MAAEVFPATVKAASAVTASLSAGPTRRALNFKAASSKRIHDEAFHIRKPRQSGSCVAAKNWNKERKMKIK